jgi:hypothetical protein
LAFLALQQKATKAKKVTNLLLLELAYINTFILSPK